MKPQPGSKEWEEMRNDAMKQCGGRCMGCKLNKDGEKAVTFNGRCSLVVHFTYEAEERRGETGHKSKVRVLVANMLCIKCLDDLNRGVYTPRKTKKKDPNQTVLEFPK